MKIATLLAFRPADLLNPIRDWRGTKGMGWTGEGTFRHMAAHVIGGAALYGAAVLIGLPHPALVAVIAVAWRQDIIMEVPACVVPLWSAIWDITTVALTAWALAALRG